jgi:glycosyltransferase involved in cell wall biosynthesis
MSNSDVVVVPSRDESCSLVALEGAMMGKPLIVTENVGAKYLVNDLNGWVVRTEDEVSLRKAFIEAIDKPELLKAMGKASRIEYLKTSTYEIFEKRFIEMVIDNLQ